MSRFFHKKSALDKRLKNIQREINSLDTTIQTMARSTGKDKAPAERPEPPARETEEVDAQVPESESAAVASADEIAAGSRRGDGVRDERFASYLMARGFDTTRPFRHERRIQRNKAIIMSLFVLGVLVWVLFRYIL